MRLNDGRKASALNRLVNDLAPHSSRIAVLGMGNALFADDGVGCYIARQLRDRISGCTGRLVLDGGTAPENFTGAVRQFAPDLVILVDAAELSLDAGQTAVIDWNQTTGCGISTHTFPAHLLASYLTQSLGCSVMLVGIQPEELSFGTELSQKVAQTASALVNDLSALLLEIEEKPLCQKSW